MSVDTKLIIKLRELTGAGVGDCKTALEEAAGDMDKAVAVMRKSGAIKAAKKADRTTKEGVIAFAVDQSKMAVVGLACETDFVSRSQDFIDTVSEFAQKLLVTDLAEFKQWADNKIKNEMVVKIGENIQLVAAELIEGEIIGRYLHSNKKVAAVVVLNNGSQELANELAMQAAAMSPKYLKPADVPETEINKEKDVYRQQLKNEGKPQAMWEKIMAGKLNKYYQDVCLLNQIYIKDDKKTVSQFVAASGKDIEVEKFYRFQI